MTYQILARKYRPQTFEEVSSQEHITTILSNAILSDRIAQTYLFTGSKGVGKTSMARIFAKSLNCKEGSSPTPCGKCDNCLEITAGNSPDVIEIDGASHTGVEDIRELQKEILFAPGKSKYKIYIIDEVHMLSKNAFNALLKTLEEPPVRIIFIFATTELYKVLPTIISRCQCFNFKKIPFENIVERLKLIFQKENIPVKDEEIFYLIAKKAEGSLRDALTLSDQLIAFSQDISKEETQKLFGIIGHGIYNEILNEVILNNKANILKIFHSIIEEGWDIQEFINGFLEYLKDLLLTKASLEKNNFSSEEKSKIYKENSQKLSENEIIYLINILLKAKSELKTIDNQILYMELLLLRLSRIKDLIPIKNIVEKFMYPNKNIVLPEIKEEEKEENIPEYEEILQKKEEILGKAPEEKPEEIVLSEQVIEQNLPTILKKVEKEKTFTAIYLKKAKLLKVQDFTLYFVIAEENAFSNLTENIKFINEVFSNHFNKEINLIFKKNELEEEKIVVEDKDLLNFMGKTNSEIIHKKI